ncbi:putative polyketide synthase [Xylariaceae sp. FL0594]|nr:putative polyketide synthase [Xylariaceae sp. FL0594]
MAHTPSSTAELRLHDMNNDIAVCGFSLKFPGDAVSPESFWKMMVDKRCASRPFPANRFKGSGFHRKEGSLNTIAVEGGHFIDEDLAAFDADFFSISAMEASSIDPMQRWLLETAFRALENGGISMDTVSGSATSVFTGSFGLDYGIQINRDPECPPAYAGLGFGISMLANRLSWFFNLQGPSIGLDSACSSSAMAIDMACQALKSGSCDMSIVAGCNLTFSPETYNWLSNLHFLSPDRRCYSFDHRANGYARGEGIAVMILKRVPDAIRDENTIRAVIRSTLSNEDGHTAGITQPSASSQARLIRETYRRAGLSMQETRYFEAHGTGTALGDPCEANAISTAFESAYAPSKPIFVGAVKSNIGHLEGASGLAGVIKTILVLEKGIIPPNTNFEKLNPKIDDYNWGLKVRLTWGRPPLVTFTSCSHATVDGTAASPSTPRGIDPAVLEEVQVPKLLVWSAADENGLQRIAKQYQHWRNSGMAPITEPEKWLGDLAYTLDSHRTHLTWRSFALIQSPVDLAEIETLMSAPVRVRAGSPPRIGFVFTGQGAQWAGMGRELMHYTSFKADILQADRFLQSLGCDWSALGLLSKADENVDIGHPGISQALCTVLQIALVDLLRRFGVAPSAVVGHSSGEIAAAYGGGYITRESAWKLAYFRGICSSDLYEASRSGVQGAMMSAGIPEERARSLVAAVERDSLDFGVTIACVNSPNNVTVAGEKQLVDELFKRLKEDGAFVRKLHVPLAYHSRQMMAVSVKYSSMVGPLYEQRGPNKVPMISSVTGERATVAQLTNPLYWVSNMVSTVRFSEAVTGMCSQSEVSLVKKIDLSHAHACVVDGLLEVGPHAALQAPIRDILQNIPRGSSISYDSALKRQLSGASTVLTALGNMYSKGITVDLRAANEPLKENGHEIRRELLVDLPEYPFDHSQSYWHESRLSRNYRLREHGPSRLLGVRSNDWNPNNARWRHFLRAEEVPWAGQHIVNGTCVYPGAGMLVMAIEAASQMANDSNGDISGYTLRNVHIEAPMDLSDGPLEVQTTLRRPLRLKDSALDFEFTVESLVRDSWLVNCHGLISAGLRDTGGWSSERSLAQRAAIARRSRELLESCQRTISCDSMYKYLKAHSLHYGPPFQVARQQRCNESGQAAARISLVPETDGEDGGKDQKSVVHPISLDALMHLCFTAFTAGGAREMATSVPSRISALWVSNEGLWKARPNGLAAFVDIASVDERGFTCNGVGMDGEGSGDIRIWYEGLELTNLSDVPRASYSNPNQFCMNIDCKVALDTLSISQLQSLLEELHPLDQVEERRSAELFVDLEMLIEKSLEVLTLSINESDLTDCEPWAKNYRDWAVYHLNRREPRGSHHGEPFQAACDRIERSNPVGRLYVAVARNLVALLKGDVNPLELLMQDDILKEYYDTLTHFQCANRITCYIDLLAHQRPGMNILEVGGGTGAGTRNITRALSAHRGQSTSLLRCNRYDFTDVSAGFMESARQEFSACGSQMTFGTLDIERSIADQGYRSGEYDLVIAVSVLHITNNLKQTLLNIRQSMKAGGKLVMQESFKPDGWTLGFVFGLFPGWWLGQQDNRALSPSITVEDWDHILKEAGFSGVDLVLRDFTQDIAHHYGWIVSTAVDRPLSDQQPTALPSPWAPSATIAINFDSTQLRAFADGLVPRLREQWNFQSTIVDTSTFVPASDGQESGLLIFLADYGTPFLHSLDRETWKPFQQLMHGYGHCLWVSGGGGRQADPLYGAVDGLARTLRLECPNLHLVTLALDAASESSRATSLLLQILSEMMHWTPFAHYEEEYIELDGRLHTRRLVEANYIKSGMDARLAPDETVALCVGSHVPFTLEAAPWNEKRMGYYAIPEPSTSLLKGDEVDIAVRAIALRRRSRSKAHQSATSFEQSGCAGVVIRTTSQSEFKVGERVFAALGGSFRSQTRVSCERVVSIPTRLTFSEACRYIPARITAFHALVNVGHAHLGSSILVHKGANLTGLFAIQLATEREVSDLWATAADERESVQIQKITGLAADRILPSTWFDSSPMLISYWKRRFSLVFDADVSSPSSLLAQCVIPRGQYIVQHRTASSPEIGGFSYLAPGISVSTFHGQEDLVGADNLDRGSLEYACNFSDATVMREYGPLLPEFLASELGSAMTSLRNMQDGQPVIIKLDDNDTVQIQRAPQPEYQLDDDATYVVCGGLGGLGRAIARWMISRGARNLILLSRSGPETPEAQDLISELQQRGVCCEAPRCDVTDRHSLEITLKECGKRLPPIKGCIQAAMVMRESAFHKMEYKDWKDAIAPKIDGSWNLHQELPRDLDFFVMLSSVMGILGTGSLAGYNAGNTYQDALARYRVARGERAAALDIGGVVDGGYLTGLTSFIAGMQRTKEYVPLLTREVCGLLDIYCNPKTKLSMEPVGCQAVVGVRPPAHWKSSQKVPWTMQQPLWGHMHNIPMPDTRQQGQQGESLLDAPPDGVETVHERDMVAKLVASGAISEAADTACLALVNRVSTMLGTRAARIDKHKAMHSYGIDSLSAMDLRNWVGKVFDVDLPIFEILGGANFVSAGNSLVRRIKSV